MKNYKIVKNGNYFSIKRKNLFGFYIDMKDVFFPNLFDTEKEALDWLEKVIL